MAQAPVTGYGSACAILGERKAGILLPVGALKATDQGALGTPALRFLDFLAAAGLRAWQMLPIHPPDPHGSPYGSCSIHAGDGRLIDTDDSAPPPDGTGALEDFERRHAAWLDDYAVYTALKAAHGGRPWWEWPVELRDREARALAAFRAGHEAAIGSCRLAQYRLFSQWAELRREATARGIVLIGDVPLFTAHDSADVWAHREYFRLDGEGQPVAVAGVPPDYFSSTGQRWGNPLYDWERMREDGFRWWIDRFRTELELFDLLRVDHFRGLEATWEIPAAHATAEHGRWCRAPGAELLSALQAGLGSLPVIAEDLGVITPEVIELRRRHGLPGMKVLQFAFDGDHTNPYLPHNHDAGCVVYTGTHDNNTTLGWFEERDAAGRERVVEYLGRPGEEMPWPLVRAALRSVSRLAVIPAQDLLGLDAAHRINTPGTIGANWDWRLPRDRLTPELAARLRKLNEIYGRC